MTTRMALRFTEADRFGLIRRAVERARNEANRFAYRQRQRKHAWQDATRMLAEACDRDWSSLT